VKKSKVTRTPMTRSLDTYRTDPVAFIDDFIKVNERGAPFTLQPHQRTVLRAAFTFDADGRLAWETFLYSCPMKSGKTTINAALCIWWAMTQEAPNELYVHANDEEQARSRVFSTILRLFRRNPGLAASAVVLDKARIVLTNETELKAMASEYAGAAGSDRGLTSWDELWAFESEASRRLWEESTPVPTRRNSIRIVSTYAGWEGESGLLHGLYLQGVGPEEHPAGGGLKIHPDLPLYLNREARVLAYWDHTPRMPWQTPRYYQDQRAALREPTYRRVHENAWGTSESTFIDGPLWDGCVDPAHYPAPPNRRLPVVLGIDAAVKRDCSAVVALTQAGDGRWPLVKHRIWTPTPLQPVNLDLIEQFVFAMFAQYDVLLVLADPFQMQSSIGRLAAAGVPIVEYTQTPGNLTMMATVLSDALKDRQLQLYADAELRQHALNTVCVETRQGLRIAREKTSRKIDAIIALSMALVAAKDCFGDSMARAVTEYAMRDDVIREEQRQLRAALPGLDLLAEPYGGYQNVVPDDTGNDYEGRDWRWTRNGRPLW